MYSVFDVIRDVLTGNITFVPANIRTERYDQCKQCPMFLNQTKRCSVCGCFMPLKTKLTKAECPVGLWGKYE
jgi:hypothetical protein